VRALTLATAAVLASGSVDATPVRIAVRGGATFDFALPEGFQAVPALPGASTTVAFQRVASDRAAELLMVFDLDGETPQSPLSARTRQALRVGDPLWMTDTDDTERTLGFTVPVLRGRSTTAGGATLVRHVALVPLEGTAVAVSVTAPLESDGAARRTLRSVLGSLHGRASWRGPIGRALEWCAGVGLVVAVTGALAFGVLTAFARQRAGVIARVRGGALALGGAGWLLIAPWTFTRGEFATRAVALGLAALGVVLVAQGLGAIRRSAAR